MSDKPVITCNVCGGTGGWIISGELIHPTWVECHKCKGLGFVNKALERAALIGWTAIAVTYISWCVLRILLVCLKAGILP